MASRNEGSTNDDEMTTRLRVLKDLTRSIGQHLIQRQQDHDPSSSILKKVSAHNPPIYGGKVDPIALENWVRDIEKLFGATNCPEDMKIKVATFYLKEEADNWWSTVEVACLAESDFSWETFKERLRARFYPVALKWQKQQEFLKLNQGGMTVQEYTDKFVELSRFAPHIIPTEEEKAKKYEEGLKFKLQKLLGGISSKTFQEAYERATNLQRIQENEDVVFNRNKRREGGDSSNQRSYDKKPRYDNRNNNEGGNNNYRGNQGFGGGINQNKGQSFNRQTSVCRGCNKPYHPGKTCAGEVVTCFKCKGLGHRAAHCPSMLDESGSQVRRPNYSGQGSRNNPGQGGIQNFNYQGYNRQGSSSGPRSSNAGNNLGTRGGSGVAKPQQQTGAGNRNDGNQARMYIMNRTEAENNPNVITGIFLIQSTPAYLLFDSGASHSFISTSFVTKLNLKPSAIHGTEVTIPSGTVISCSKLFENVPIDIAGSQLTADFIQFDLAEFDAILGMDWLSKYKASLDCHEQKVSLRGPRGIRISYKGVMMKPGIKIIYMMKAMSYSRKGYPIFLCNVRDTTLEEKLEEIRVIREYADVFPDEIPGVPPYREVELSIDVIPGTSPIS